MTVEIEIKARLGSPRALRAKLKSLGARFAGLDKERNNRLDTKGRALEKQKNALRVRELGKGCLVTMKLFRRAKRTKQREEIEFEAQSPKTVLRMFAKLGYTPIWVYEKRRENYTLGRAHVCIDQLPRMGWFAEIEAPTEREVLATARRLGLPKKSLTTKHYPQLAKEQFHTKKVPNLAF